MIGLLGKGLNSGNWHPLEMAIIREGIKYQFLPNHNEISESHTIVISLGYDRIIPQECLVRPKFGVAVFHSSDLPKGRGWAPLFYTIINKERYLTQTLFYADADIDSGPIIAKAKYPLNSLMTVSDLRVIDDFLTWALVDMYIGKMSRRKLNATPQNHAEATYWDRRYPKDSRIDATKSLAELYDSIRALPDNLPAFFEKDGATVEVRLNIRSNFIFNPAEIIIEDYVRQ